LPSVSSLKALRCYLVAEPAERSSGCPDAPSTPAAIQTAAAQTPERGFSLAAFGAPILQGAPQDGSRGAPPADGILGEGRLADVAKLRALPYLPGSKAELDALKTRYPLALIRTGVAATETAVRQGDADPLSRARFVVFSTHGLMAGSTAGEPGLVLTPPAEATEADDGYLSASEAAQLGCTPSSWSCRPAIPRPPTAGRAGRGCRVWPAPSSMPERDRCWCRTGRSRTQQPPN
jgi:hypothetical protein